jgi:hypothetical protein
MSETDRFCISSELTKEEQKLCCQFHDDLLDILADLDKKGYLRSDLRIKQGENGRIYSEHVITNVREVTDAFNKLSDMYFDKERQKKFLELNKPYGMTKKHLNYLFFSDMIFVFLQNIEAFRVFLLFILKSPIRSSKGKKRIDEKTALHQLLVGLKELGIEKAGTLDVIDYDLRNGLSHCLFWLDKNGDSEHLRPHLRYSMDITFKRIRCISIGDFLSKSRKQAIYTKCLSYVILDWFRFAQ